MQLMLVMTLLLLAAGPQLQAVAASSDATAQLEAAARINDVAAAKQAIQDGADVNAQGGGGQTPIMAATLAGSTDIVRCVL
jgi:ankyrin repeat protein